VFIVDILALKTSVKLDFLLTKIFTHPETSVLGFGFSADISQLRKECPKMSFHARIPNLMEVQDFYKALFPDFKENGGFGLASVCLRVMKKKLCKLEQMSNWEKRPLRFS